ncbi:unnamed protein product, partial [Citrullus colocynthis]
MAPRRVPIRRDKTQGEPTRVKNQGNGQTPYVLLTPEALQMLIQNMSNGSNTSSTTPVVNDTNDSKLIREFKKFDRLIFDGSSMDPNIAENWIAEIETIFRHMNTPEEQK